MPGNASGGMDGIALKPLTVSFSELGFAATLNQENQFGPWFTLSTNERQHLGIPMGPQNPQALNRYSYVLNNPMRWTDPSGHFGITIHDNSTFTLHFSSAEVNGLSDVTGESANASGHPDGEAILKALQLLGNTLASVDYFSGGHGVDITINPLNPNALITSVTPGTVERQNGTFLDNGVSQMQQDIGIWMLRQFEPRLQPSVAAGSCNRPYPVTLNADSSKVHGPPVPSTRYEVRSP